jgi:hypothetical protein
MRGTDYDLPAGWSGMTDRERDKWMKNERSRRQAERQSKTGSMPAINELINSLEREERRLEARSQTWDVKR